MPKRLSGSEPERLCADIGTVAGVRFCRRMAAGLLHLGELSTARDYLEYALRVASEACAEEVPSLYSDLAHLHLLRGERAAALDMYRRGWALVHNCEHPDKARLLNGMGLQQEFHGRWHMAEKLYRTAMEQTAGALGAHYAKANLAGILSERGFYDEAGLMETEVAQHLLNLGDEVGYTYVQVNLLNELAHLDRRRDFEALARDIEACIDHPTFQDLRFDFYDTELIYYLRLCDSDQAFRMLGQLAALMETGHYLTKEALFCVRRAMCFLHADDATEALASLRGYSIGATDPAKYRLAFFYELAKSARAVGNTPLTRESERKLLLLMKGLGFSKERIRHLQAGLRFRVQGKKAMVSREPFGAWGGKSFAATLVRNLVSKIAMSDATLLLTGESGTGKTMMARLVHSASSRKQHPFIVFDCTCNDEGLVESLLFGHNKGAFTGAIESRRGLVELAHNGTLFIDEIGDLPLSLQGKLLGFIDSQAFRPVGSASARYVDVRLIVATNRNLDDEVAGKRFREDLFYRLGVLRVELPPLRQRTEDIPSLAERLMSELNQKYKSRKWLSQEALVVLQSQKWPGNIRELKKCLERAVLLSENDEIGVQEISLGAKCETSMAPRTLDAVERDHIMMILSLTNGNKSKAARMLGLKRTTLYSRMSNLGMQV